MSNTVECPYCEHYNKVTYDDHDGQDNFDMTCRNCGEEFEVNVEYNPTYNSSKIEYFECDKCKEQDRDICKRGSCFPFPKNKQYNKLCHDCYVIEYFKEQDEK